MVQCSVHIVIFKIYINKYETLFIYKQFHKSKRGYFHNHLVISQVFKAMGEKGRVGGERKREHSTDMYGLNEC